MTQIATERGTLILAAPVENSIFAQQGYRCRLEWGLRGAREAAARGDILVVVDTLRFSTAAVTAVHYGGYLYPCAEEEDLQALAQRVGAEAGAHRAEPSGRYSLSPRSYFDLPSGARIALTSLNGATCSRYAQDVPFLFVGAFVNALATAKAVTQVLDNTEYDVTILACGERYSKSKIQNPKSKILDGGLRFALEDYLGAGAILFSLSHSQSPEARACAGAFLHLRADLETVLMECGSGRELRAKGLAEDVKHAARLNLYDTVAVMRGERLEKQG